MLAGARNFGRLWRGTPNKALQMTVNPLRDLAVARCRLGRDLRRRWFSVRCCCGVLLLSTPFIHAYSDLGKWLLMSRHGECSEIAALERKVADIEGIDDPTTFVRVMRQRGYEVTERTMPEVGGEAMQVDVPAKGLSLLFVRESLCPDTNQGQGNHDGTWTVTMAPNKVLQLTRISVGRFIRG